MLLPIEDKEKNKEGISSIFLMSGKEILNEVKKEQDMQFSIMRKPRVIHTNNFLEDLPEEIQELLETFVDIVVYELPHSLPPIRSISHHINLIPGDSLPNKSAYRLIPRDNEKVKN
jgi:DNA-directed RNA polymerase subunit F